jgi:hypothetical protein
LIYRIEMCLIKLKYTSQAKSVTEHKHSDNILLTEMNLLPLKNFSDENVFSTLLIRLDNYVNQSLNQKVTVNFVFANVGFNQLQKERHSFFTQY